MSFNTLKTILRSLQTTVDEDMDHDDHDDDDDHDPLEEDHDDHEAEMLGGAEGESSLDIQSFKIIILFAMIACVGLGFIPKAWGKCRDNEYTLSFLNCFSAGIFLAMSLVHMMPESAEMYADWALDEGIERPFPLPYVMFFMGYMLILAVDRVAARAYHGSHGDHGDHETTKPVTPLNPASIGRENDLNKPYIVNSEAVELGVVSSIPVP